MGKLATDELLASVTRCRPVYVGTQCALVRSTAFGVASDAGQTGNIAHVIPVDMHAGGQRV
ncbi:hypothetical protein D2E35_21100 [Mycobacteroides abscessus]|nr:hypothetical protein D2E35_21100 [Mycobacteroides abscessus]